MIPVLPLAVGAPKRATDTPEADPAGAGRNQGAELPPATEAFASLLAAALGLPPPPLAVGSPSAADRGASKEPEESPVDADAPGDAGTEPDDRAASPAGGASISPRRLPVPGEAHPQPLPIDATEPWRIARPQPLPVPRPLPLPGEAQPQPLPINGSSPAGAAIPAAASSAARGAGAAGEAVRAAPVRPGAPHHADVDLRIDPHRVERRSELLDPQLRVRVERVVDRMYQEHAHRVDVVETLRHQVRQNHLFEQGRSRPGPVVTWTRASQHTHGRAVDVIIDGSYGNPAAYERLGRIAAEEGLRTLGPRDPGHLELPQRVGEGAPDISRAGGAPGPARSWPGAAPASVQAPATVATVAAVATPSAPVAAAVAAQPATVARVATAAQGAAPGRRPAARDDAARVAGRPIPAEGSHAGPAPVAIADTPRGAVPTGSTSASAPQAMGAGTAARLAHLLDLQTAMPLRPLQQVVLRIDGPAGPDRIRLGLRGNSLEGSIALTDPAATERLTGRVGELQRSLLARGIEAESLRVRTLVRGDTVEITRAAAGLAADADLQRTSFRSAADGGAARERAAQSQHQEPRDGASDPRQRSRQEQRQGQDP